MTTKERIHRLVDDLPESELDTVKRVLEGLSVLSLPDPVAEAHANTPVDDESVTDEEAQAIEEVSAISMQVKLSTSTKYGRAGAPRNVTVRFTSKACEDLEGLPHNDRRRVVEALARWLFLPGWRSL